MTIPGVLRLAAGAARRPLAQDARYIAFVLLLLGIAAAGDPAVKPPRAAHEGESWVPEASEPAHAPAPLDDFWDLRGIFHAHSKYSHDSKVEPERIVAIANALGLDFFFMTDHPSPKSLEEGLRGRKGRTLFFAGAETGGLLALDLKEPVRGGTAAEQIAHVQSQGGIALIAHPEEWTEWDARFQGMEVFNLHYGTLKDGPLGKAIESAKEKKGLEKLAAMLEVLDKDPDAKRVLAALEHVEEDPESLLLELVRRPALYLARWDALGRGRRVPGVAANDSHENVRLGGKQLDPYERTLRVVDTHLLARGREAADVREALLEGRGYVAHEVYGEARGFVFFARDPSGKRRAVLGEEVCLDDGPLLLVARTPARAAIRLLRDGAPVASVGGDELVFPVPRGGVYRIEVDLERRGRTVPWITSNPIYVREAD